MLNFKKNKNWSTYLFFISMMVIQSAMAQFPLKISPPVQIFAASNTYSDPPANTQFRPCDAVCATFKDANRFYVYHSTDHWTFKFSGFVGPLSNPQSTEQTLMPGFPKRAKDMFAIPSTFTNITFDETKIPSPSKMVVNVYLKNIYQITANDPLKLLGFVHLEYISSITYPPGGAIVTYDHYSIGVCYSSNGGDNWTFCGEIVRPTPPYKKNVGGAAYIIMGSYFYVYFNEETSSGQFPSVARALITDVCTKAASSKTTTWYKYSGKVSGANTWNSNAMTAGGKAIVITPTALDLHSDAAYCSYLNQYLLIVNDRNGTTPGLYVYSSGSTDGITWSNRQLIAADYTDAAGVARNVLYPFFASFNADASSVCSTVGKMFYIYYIPMHYPTGSETWLPSYVPLWRVEVGHNTIAPVQSLLLNGN